MNEPIPAYIDHLEILDELTQLGWRDFKIETVCGFASGYIAQLRCRNVANMSYHRAARLYNFWLDERSRALQNQVCAVTS